jgi:Fe-S-cluster containining protein
VWVGVFDKKDSEPVYRIWMKPGTREFADSCPFLIQSPAEKQHWICRIHDVKPEICRQYPVSRKHGIMTGCRGFRHEKV